MRARKRERKREGERERERERERENESFLPIVLRLRLFTFCVVCTFPGAIFLFAFHAGIHVTNYIALKTYLRMKKLLNKKI